MIALPAAEILEPLNEVQRQAVVHEQGPLLVLAGAGSGKTRVITHRIAYLLAHRGVPAEAIAALTFTNRAAAEMAERIGRLAGGAASGVRIGTFHAFSAQLLRRYATLGTGRSAGFTIYDEDDQHRLLRTLLAERSLAGEAGSAAELASWLDRVKSRGGEASAVALPPGFERGRSLELYARYEEELRRADAFDFGDLIQKLVQLLETYPSARAALQERFRHLLVDEYQDTSPIQDRLIELLAGSGQHLTVVGDDDQAIYGWRGATADNILTFPERYAGCTIVRLEHNYRSREPILEAANAIIHRSSRRLGKILRQVRGPGRPLEVFGFDDERAEAQGVVQLLREYQQAGGELTEVAIFYRTAALTPRLEDALRRANLPYRLPGGVRFHERAEVKDLLAWARLFVNPHDAVAAVRAMTTPRRGIGEKTIGRVRTIVVQRGCSWLEAAVRVVAEEQPARGKGVRGLASFLALVEELQERVLSVAPSVALELLLEQSGLLALHAGGRELEARERYAQLRELLLSAAEVETRDPAIRLAGFLEQSALAAEPTQPAAGVVLLTLHAAKGLEFPWVIIVGLEEGTFPLTREDSDPEEERRLCYVGMTRAQERLVLTWARQRRRFDEVRSCEPSRFLRELPAAALAVQVRPEPEEDPRVGLLRRPRRGVTESQVGPAQPSAAREERCDPFPDYGGGSDGWGWNEEVGAAEQWSVGDRVLHERMGEGEVVELLGARVAVRFEFRGVKRVDRGFLRRI